MNRPTLGIVGAGKVGSTLARLWFGAGYTVRAIYSRRAESAQRLASLMGAEVVATAGAVVQAADLTLLTVPDDMIESVALALSNADLNDKAIVHTSGVHNTSRLAAVAARGAAVGGLHPAFPFADVEAAILNLAGAAFALETETLLLRTWLEDLVAAIGGRVLLISSDQKVLYHLALAMLSNYTVTLYAIAERLLMELGTEREVAEAALKPLLAGTVENIRVKGIPTALTGALSRGDAGTVKQHILALAQLDSNLEALYLQLAQQTLPLLNPGNRAAVEPVLKWGEHHAVDNT